METVPERQVACARDQPLTGVEVGPQDAAGVVRSTTPICAGRRANTAGARTTPVRARTPAGQRRGFREGCDRRIRPAHRRCLSTGGGKIITERGAKRAFITLLTVTASIIGGPRCLLGRLGFG